MKHQSWHLNRRELLKGGGIAPALPFLNGMGRAMGMTASGGQALPKRMPVSYFATGADLAGQEKTNNISVDQVAANALGHHTRFASMLNTADVPTEKFADSTGEMTEIC